MNTKFKAVRKAIFNVQPYIPGKTVEEVKKSLSLDEIIKLGSNENSYGPFPSSLVAMEKELVKLNQYPETSFIEIKEVIANKNGLEPDNIAISHGIEGMIQTICKVFINDGDRVVIPTLTFGLYGEMSKAMGAEIKYADLNHFNIDLEAVIKETNEKTKLIWLCNPNNPTGTYFTQSDFSTLMLNKPKDTWVIVDEAYREFVESDNYPDSVKEVKTGKQVIVLRTFSKAYGLAGARLGYCLADKEMVGIIERASEAFNANRVALAGAKAALLDDDYFNYCLMNIKSERKLITKELIEMGFQVVDSQATFLLFFGDFNAGQLTEFLLKRGVIVRSAEGWGFNNGIRVSIGNKYENQKFLDTLREFI